MRVPYSVLLHLEFIAVEMASARPLVVFGTASFGNGTPQAKFRNAEEAGPVLSLLQSAKITHVDTARAYPVGAPGTAEKLLGELEVASWATVSTKVTSWAPGSHSGASIRRSVEESLAALGVDKVDIMYLHTPDRSTPFLETCRAMDSEFRRGKFERFGISNYTAEEVTQIVDICEREGLVKPSVYQGRYNVIIRGGEEELFPLLRKHNISFYAYSPGAAGVFSGRITKDSGNVEGSRWDSKVYQQVYFKPSVLEMAQKTADAAAAAGVDGHSVALRWAAYHSSLSASHGDAIVLGASSVEQLKRNLDAIDAGPLPADLSKLVESVSEAVKKDAAAYHL
ncbi:NADP-dependent oxidoreductase domain-containing protein [Neofusicoccum parvum]|uniref:NADP-dependent oxidoreductase domain-containing protein n=1 Tax=Neofusicoccum parvum TaxID=310453 RepID=A0ACB5SQ06_9PEZI|nr:NADP-dependent oxidoreductase domain-containing protein [Neofusicoccum parvum]